MKDAESKKARCLAILGTGSDVGKSIVVTALCRILRDRGVRVCPFKAQNMSNNSGVTPEGLEMGRAQMVQAEAARLAPHVDMNPVLLKPVSRVGSQVVVLGRVVQDFSASQYYREKDRFFETARESLDRLRSAHDAVILEGAGSCAEVNLMDRDMVNLSMAEYAQAPAVLVADIDRGGVFAQIIGTLACLEKKHQDRIIGFVINRFRGDIALFQDGVSWIAAKTGKKVFGVLPWFDHFRIPSEDAVAIERPGPPRVSGDAPTVAVVRLPHISNFTDMDPLFRVPGLGVRFVETAQDLFSFKAVILPGSKSTRQDLEWLSSAGWKEKIIAYAQNGGHVLGICGGFQMLGREVQDPDGLEGSPGAAFGLDLLPHVTVLKAPKTTTLTRFDWDGVPGCGYEIHMGRTRLSKFGEPPCPGTPGLVSVSARNGLACQDQDGAVSGNGRVMGTYLHGFFDAPGILKKWLGCIGLPDIQVPRESFFQARDRQYDLLARHFEDHVDVDAMTAGIGL